MSPLGARQLVGNAALGSVQFDVASLPLVGPKITRLLSTSSYPTCHGRGLIWKLHADSNAASLIFQTNKLY
jgi:hypothetical protein